MPMVHYIPLRYDFSDLHTRYEWAKANPDKCEQIARQATEFMKAFQSKEMEDRLMRAVMDFYLRFDAAPRDGASNLTQCQPKDTTAFLDADYASTRAQPASSHAVFYKLVKRSDNAIFYKYDDTWYYINSPTACPKLDLQSSKLLDMRCHATYLKNVGLGSDISAWCPTNGLVRSSYSPNIGYLPPKVFTKVCQAQQHVEGQNEKRDREVVAWERSPRAAIDFPVSRRWHTSVARATSDRQNWNSMFSTVECQQAADCEARTALANFFWERVGGVSVELGGLDGDKASESKALEQAWKWGGRSEDAVAAHIAHHRCLTTTVTARHTLL